MGRAVNLSPLGLYQWDQTIFDLMQIPTALDKPTLIDNLLAETAELEVLYPNPVVFKNLVGVWSAKQIDIWNRLYATTQYEYNPIENYNRYETGSTDGAGSTTHSGTDASTESTTYGGTDGRTEGIMHGGTDTVTHSNTEGGTQGEQKTGQLATGGTDTVTHSNTEGGTQGESKTGSKTLGGTDTVTHRNTEGGTEGESTTSRLANSGSDVVTGSDTKGHWIAGFNSTPSGQDDGLVKQTRDQDDATTTTQYGKIESGTGSKTTTFGKTENGSDATAYGKTENTTEGSTTTFGKTENGSDATAYGKTESTTEGSTTTFGKTENGSDATAYGKTENITEQRTYGQTISKTGGLTHGEQVRTTEEGSHELHAHGNIGVTTTQKLIREQRNIELFNLYDIIIEDFKMRFCILIY